MQCTANCKKSNESVLRRVAALRLCGIFAWPFQNAAKMLKRHDRTGMATNEAKLKTKQRTRTATKK